MSELGPKKYVFSNDGENMEYSPQDLDKEKPCLYILMMIFISASLDGFARFECLFF